MQPGPADETDVASDPADRQRPPGTIRIGQIAGVDVLVQASWLLIALLFTVSLAPTLEIIQPGLGGLKYVAGLALVVLLYLAILLHEVSHAVMARRFGLPVGSITLHFLGGHTQIEREPDTPGRAFGVSVVGPLTSAAVGLAAVPFALLTTDDTLLDLAFNMLAGANLFIAVLNLVPGLPLDGGHVLRAAVWKATGNPHRGSIVAGWVGRVCAVLVAFWPFVQQQVTGRGPSVTSYVFALVIAWFLWSGASQAIAMARIRMRLPALRARSLARRALSMPHDVPLAEAVRRAQEQQAGSIVLLDQSGAPQALASEAAVVATPEDRWPWLPLSAVARTIEPGIVLPADISGEPLLLAMQRTPASEYLLTETDGTVFGVLATDDVDRAFADNRR